jgi:hypothetical protein
MAVDLTAVKDYLGTAATQWDDDQLTKALAAESRAQGNKCRRPPVGGEDLDEALCRRVARNLAMRKIPLGIATSEIEAMRVAAVDPEIRRLEGPHRKLPIA